MDIWVAMHHQNAERIVQALVEFGFDTPELVPGLFLEESRIVRMGVPPVRLEIITTVSGISFNECFSQRVVDLIDGIEVSLINLQRLRVNKKASGRYKDLNDLENLPAA